MKFKVDVECTPAEARQFIGLPDVAPMQEAMMKELQKQMMDNVKGLDPETIMKTWMTPSIQGWSEMQKVFWGQMGFKAPDADGGAPKATVKPK